MNRRKGNRFGKKVDNNQWKPNEAPAPQNQNYLAIEEDDPDCLCKTGPSGSRPVCPVHEYGLKAQLAEAQRQQQEVEKPKKKKKKKKNATEETPNLKRRLSDVDVPLYFRIIFACFLICLFCGLIIAALGYMGNDYHFRKLAKRYEHLFSFYITQDKDV